MGFLRDLGGWHLLIILVIIVLLFGASRLPAVSKSLGQSMRIFRKEVKGLKDDAKADEAKDGEPSREGSAAPADKQTTPDDKL
ncbi:Sec-independent protein translocase subunit TatA [Gryllotalpicola ginsengisoli]|uniref:Sec-independent protein translocase subunit TatA n=1 Tax=Gryllotalpicola ginsengisoli TaxID=444608 RepID=UPI0003B432BD|nr:Sec-independent protein translocase subunit TatA [Gryllotalpicola ginsengisoli]